MTTNILSQLNLVTELRILILKQGIEEYNVEDVANIRKVLSQLSNCIYKHETVQPKKITELINKYHHININARTRKRIVVNYRQCAHYFAKEITNASLSEIGLWCGGVDHSTVLHSLKVVSDLRDSKDVEFMQIYENVERLVSPLKI